MKKGKREVVKKGKTSRNKEEKGARKDDDGEGN